MGIRGLIFLALTSATIIVIAVAVYSPMPDPVSAEVAEEQRLKDLQMNARISSLFLPAHLRLVNASEQLIIDYATKYRKYLSDDAKNALKRWDDECRESQAIIPPLLEVV